MATCVQPRRGCGRRRVARPSCLVWQVQRLLDATGVVVGGGGGGGGGSGGASPSGSPSRGAAGHAVGVSAQAAPVQLSFYERLQEQKRRDGVQDGGPKFITLTPPVSRPPTGAKADGGGGA